MASGFSCRVVCCAKNQNLGTVVFSPQNIQPQMLYKTQMLPSTNMVSTNPPPTNEDIGHEAGTYTSASEYPGTAGAEF